MIAELLGSKNRERVLVYILTNKEGYTKEISELL